MPTSLHRCFVFALVSQVPAIACPGSLAAQARTCPAIVIDSAQMLNDVARLADDSMRGRFVGTRGDHQARDFIAARFDALGLARVDGSRIEPFTFPMAGDSVTGDNVAGIVRGTQFPGRFIVVSAHFDHIGSVGAGMCRALGADSICNGADDNGSGTAGILALAGYFSAHPPTHSLLFLAFDAEEEGDVGSHAWVAHAPVPLDSILVDVNLDMVGRNIHQQLFASGPDRYSAEKPLVEAAAACTPITLTIGHDGEAGRDDWTDQSDQGAFNARKIPFVYFGEEDHPDYHRPGDQVERLMPGFYAAAVRAVGGFVASYDAALVGARR